MDSWIIGNKGGEEEVRKGFIPSQLASFDFASLRTLKKKNGKRGNLLTVF